ncbi:acyl-homoserine lactone synthase [Rhodopseudomonas rhenobacensis]|uniref:Acyl-homoserine lactone synthase n=1 Tax=Rhodopseudomonas rhenobacensis TaxID=87461 RepID=A0A7W8E1U6_9BRAD|nr:GNAT family N-acetyltransferase [Rhodopseudomonas rhenobacensis]MBB5049281.1 acyl-homoserine lactone synthase [Rhodopseudomonas rhenobacensis]
MIRVIDQANQLRYRETLERQFRFRHEIFVKERGWTAFEQDGRYEVDQYDNEKTIYVVALDDERVVGCFRLYPTQAPHMISEVFSYLVDGPVPQRSDLLEMTRISVSRDKRGGGTYYELLTGLQEYGLQQGLSAVTAVIRSFRMSVVQDAGFRVHPLGLPREVEGETLIAVMFEIGEDSLERIRRTAGITGPVLERAAQPAEALQRKLA